MSPSPDLLESVIADALEAEADAVDPRTDAAWRRLEGVAGRRRPRARAGLVVGALVAAAAMVAMVVVLRDTDPEVDTGPATSDGSTDITVPPDLPDLIAAVRETDGNLVLLDGAGQLVDEVELSPKSVLGPIEALDLSPDGSWVYFTTCCVGNAYRVPATGGQPERVGMTGPVAVSPDGAWVAGDVLRGQDFLRAVARTDRSEQPVVSAVTGGGMYQPAWSPDGQHVAFITDPDGGRANDERVVEVTFDGTSLGEPVDRGPGQHAHYAADGTLHTVTDTDLAGLQAWAPDLGTSWVLEVTREGVLQYRRSDAPDEPAVVLGRGYRTADW